MTALDVAKAMLFIRPIAEFESHRPLLAKALVNSDGPVIELGMGWGSTPFLHAYCAAAKRHLVSVESDKSWADRFSPLQTPQHEIITVTSWDEAPIESRMWGLAFVDHSPAERREVELRRLKGRCGIAVVHDLGSCAPPPAALRSMFAYVCVDEGPPPTGIVSDTADVSVWSL